ncbi:MAG TPA: hypothetical protein VLE99_03075, partial [Candidatus Saccharimonadales bacterium]|nr:hypothetical protein [Candidatus Saccharimonadales bacterium]
MAERSSERGAPVCSSWDVATSGDTICWYDDTNWHQLIVGVGHQLTWKFDRAKREELDRAQARVDLASEALREALNIGAVTKCDNYAADKVLDARE